MAYLEERAENMRPVSAGTVVNCCIGVSGWIWYNLSHEKVDLSLSGAR